MRKILITSPSLDSNKNVSGVSAITNFVINNNISFHYDHFELGRYDNEKRNVSWLLRFTTAWFYWYYLLFREKKYLVHFNLALAKKSLLRDLPLVLYARLLRRGMVIHLHGGVYLQQKNAPKLLAFFLRIALSGKNTVIVLSPLEKKLIIQKYNAKTVVVLPTCVDMFNAQKFTRKNTYISPIKLLFIGRICKEKGLDFIYEALSDLYRKNISFKFIMAGNGPGKFEYLKKFESLLGDKFEYKGVVSGDAKLDLFKSCNVLLLPSLFEGLPISLLECMSFGMVPIVTDVGSIKYVVKHGENGVIVKKGSANEIANAIENLSNNSELLEKMGGNAKQLISEEFDPAIYIEKLNVVYMNAFAI